MWKETVVPSFEAQYQHLLGLEKTTKIEVTKNDLWGRDLISGRPEYEARVLRTQVRDIIYHVQILKLPRSEPANNYIHNLYSAVLALNRLKKKALIKVCAFVTQWSVRALQADSSPTPTYQPWRLPPAASPTLRHPPSGLKTVKKK
jgi:hypothetical protein